MPNALTTPGGIRSWGWLILKFSSDLGAHSRYEPSGLAFITQNAIALATHRTLKEALQAPHLSVCAPQYFSEGTWRPVNTFILHHTALQEGTWISPNASLSVLVDAACICLQSALVPKTGRNPSFYAIAHSCGSYGRVFEPCRDWSRTILAVEVNVLQLCLVPGKRRRGNLKLRGGAATGGECIGIDL
jgi:hypothetical protein